MYALLIVYCMDVFKCFILCGFSELLGTPGYLAPEMLQVSVGNPDFEGYGKEIDL